jgi:cell division protein FtsB
LDDDFDVRSDAFGLDTLQSRRGTTTTLGEKKLLADSQAQVATLQERIDELQALMKSKDEEISRLQDEHEKSQVCRNPEYLSAYDGETNSNVDQCQ